MSENLTRPPSSGSSPRAVARGEALIWRAFWWSLAGFAVIGLGIAGAFYVTGHQAAHAPTALTRLTVPTVAARTMQTEVPNGRFTDITRAAGLKFAHHNGAYGEKLLPETMGSGVAFFDFDNDGAADLLCVNACDWPWRTNPVSPAPTLRLFHNGWDGQFTDVTAGSGLDITIYGQGVAIGDFDNDGLEDVFITAVGGNHLFKNLGSGHFRDITAEAGVGGATNQWSTSGAFVDYDNDGRLDLFVCNYVKWSREIDVEVGYKLVGVGRAYGQPVNFEGTFPTLYHNEGNGHFRDVTREAGLQIRNPSTGVPAAKSLGVAPVDLDGDGWLDFVVANDSVQNFVFHNKGDGTFEEIGAQSGLAFDPYGATRGAMGIDAAHYRDDGALGIAIGNFANEMTALYVSQKAPLLFADEAIPEGVGPASRLLLKFGIFFFDYDLDGRLDLLSCDGHLEEEIGRIQHSQTYAQPAQLFWNCGASNGATFVEVPRERVGPDLFKPIVGRGSAYADIDGDGDLDVILTQTGGAPLLLRNDQGLGHHWLRLKLIGHRSNRSAIGAQVRARVNGRLLVREVMPTRSYLSQSELPITLGLGSATSVDSLEVIWPGGRRQGVTVARVDTLQTVDEAAEPIAPGGDLPTK